MVRRMRMLFSGEAGLETGTRKKSVITTDDVQKLSPIYGRSIFILGVFSHFGPRFFSCLKSFFLDNIIGNQTLKFAIPGGAGPVSFIIEKIEITDEISCHRK